MLPFALTAVASMLLLVSLRLPLWQMRLESPQYRDQEALRIAVHPDSLRGDIRELSVLQQYIGVHIPPTLPQFKWLPGLLIAGAVLGFRRLLGSDSGPPSCLGICQLRAGCRSGAGRRSGDVSDSRYWP